MKNFKAKYGYDLAVPKTYAQLRDIAEFFNRPDQKQLRPRHVHRQRVRRDGDGRRETIFSYGGELGDYATYKVDGIINSNEHQGLEMYNDL